MSGESDDEDDAADGTCAAAVRAVIASIIEEKSWSRAPEIHFIININKCCKSRMHIDAHESSACDFNTVLRLCRCSTSVPVVLTARQQREHFRSRFPLHLRCYSYCDCKRDGRSSGCVRHSCARSIPTTARSAGPRPTTPRRQHGAPRLWHGARVSW